MRRFVLLCFFSLLASSPAPAVEQNLRVELLLNDSIQRSLRSSSRLEAAELDQSAAQSRADSQYSTLWPRISLDASFRYVTQVPTLTLQPGKTLPFGDNQSYSVGPLLTWTLFESSMGSNAWHSFQEQEKSKKAEHDLIERQVILGVRLAYLRILQASEEMKLVVDSLKLAQAQYRDIEKRYEVGSASKTDTLSAHHEVLKYQIQFQSRQSELSTALQELFSFTDQGQELDLSRPVDSRTFELHSDAAGTPSLIVNSESIESTLAALSGLKESSAPSTMHPQLKIFEHVAEAYSQSAESSAAGHWPKIQFFAKSSYDYPNGPVLDKVQQNTIGVNASWSLFEFGRIKNEVSEKRSLAHASESRREQAKTDLLKDWRNAKNLLNSLQVQKKINQTSAEEAESIGKLVYASYRAGRSTFLEVETANLHSHEAKIQATRNDIQILFQLATLAHLSEDK